MSFRLEYTRLILILFLSAIYIAAKANKYVSFDSTKMEGVIIQKNTFSKQVSILMQDTSLSGNRFDYRWHAGADSSGTISTMNYMLSAYIVDSTLAIYCDSVLVNGSLDVSVTNSSFPKRDLNRLIKRSIRLYIGYIDNNGKLNIVVQFVSPKEFRKRQYLYKKELFLVVPQKKLQFATIHFKSTIDKASHNSAFKQLGLDVGAMGGSTLPS